jgi:catechol 2,3-dioxygenase
MRWLLQSMLPRLAWSGPEKENSAPQDGDRNDGGAMSSCEPEVVAVTFLSMEILMTAQSKLETEVQTPCDLNHLVLNVRDLEEAHQFWTECLGFCQVGTSHRHAAGAKPMRFYSGELNGKLRHHDIALVERPTLPADRDGNPQALNHVAIAYPTREAWQKQIWFLIARGVTLYRQIDRGVTQSIHLAVPDGNEIELVYELPREMWEGDIDAALNRAVERPVAE